jgi:serine protease Do
MKRLFVLIAWAIAANSVWAEMDRSALIGMSASVLKIETLRVQGGVSLGTGVVVAPERIVTNCHVTRDALKINVLRGDVRWQVDAQLSDIDRDLCLLHVPGLQAAPVALGQTDRMKPGQPVTALGFTGGLGMQNSRGEVLALHRFDGGRVIRSSNWFSSGASGGGLFDDELRLVGILTFRLRGGEAHYFAAPVEWLAVLLDASAQPGYREVAPEPSRRLAYWQRPLPDQPRFLTAALLQRGAQWQELESLATEWTREDALDPEPWSLMGLALAKMDRLPEAQRALECSMVAEMSFAAGAARLDDRTGRPVAVIPSGAVLHSSMTPAGASLPCSIGAPSSLKP